MKGLRIVLAALLVSAMMAFAGPALAQEGSDDGPIVRPDRITKPGNGGPNVGPSTLERGATTADSAGAADTLPFTGSDLLVFVVIAAGAIGAGSLLVRSSRSRRAEA